MFHPRGRCEAVSGLAFTHSLEAGGDVLGLARALRRNLTIEEQSACRAVSGSSGCQDVIVPSATSRWRERVDCSYLCELVVCPSRTEGGQDGQQGAGT